MLYGLDQLYSKDCSAPSEIEYDLGDSNQTDDFKEVARNKSLAKFQGKSTTALIIARTMVNFLRYCLSSGLLVFSLAQQGLALVLEDTEAPDTFKPLLERGTEPSEDALFSSYNRLSKESYYWSGIVAYRPTEITC